MRWWLAQSRSSTSKLLEELDAIYEAEFSIGDNKLNGIEVSFASKTPPKICFAIYRSLKFVATRAEEPQVSLGYLAWNLQAFDHKLKPQVRSKFVKLFATKSFIHRCYDACANLSESKIPKFSNTRRRGSEVII